MFLRIVPERVVVDRKSRLKLRLGGVGRIFCKEKG